jgi:hypothetical protein
LSLTDHGCIKIIEKIGLRVFLKGPRVLDCVTQLRINSNMT